MKIRNFVQSVGSGAVLLTALPSLSLAFEANLTAEGGSNSLEKRLSAGSLAITLAQDDEGTHTSSEILAAARADYTTLISLLYDAGYFGPSIHIYIDGVEASTIPPLAAPETIAKVQIEVDTGPQFRFGKAEIGPLPPGSDMPDSYATGEPAQTSSIRAAARTALSDWRDASHAKADISGQTIVADHDNAILDVEVELMPGPELDFGALTVEGNQDVRTDAILRIAGYPQGEDFDPEELDTVTRRLRRTGAFSSVSVTEADEPNADGTLDIGLTVGEQLPRRFSFGIEYGTDDGLELSGEWIHRNLFGGAERLKIEASTGTEFSSGFDGKLKFRLDLPAYLGTDNDLFFFGGIEWLDEPNYDTLNLSLGTGVRRVFSETLTGEIGFGPFFSTVDDAYGDDREFYHIRFPSSLEWDLRDDSVSATQGIYLRTGLTPFIGLNGTDSGLSAKVDGRAYVSLGERIVLAGRAQIGSVVGASASSTPPDLLYFSGGSDTVRGQPYQSLGLAVNGDLAGGRSFLGLSAEVRTAITDAITIVGFYDYGMVGADSFVDSADDSHAGAGIGLRYNLSGIGALRVDFALPVQGDTGDGLQFYIGIGQAF